MEALSKAPGAETAVWEGDKRRQSWGLGVAMGGPPPHQHFLFKGGFKGRQRDRERAERWMRCLSDPLCPYPPPQPEMFSYQQLKGNFDDDDHFTARLSEEKV